MSSPGSAPWAPPAQRPLLGIVLILLAVACFAMLDTSAKLAGATAPVLGMLFVRYMVQALLMGAWLLRPAHRPLLRSAHPRFQCVRGLLLLSVSALGLWGLQLMPVAEFTAVVMLTPVIVTVLAVVLLKERLTRWRWALVIGGFAGALVIVRPGSGLFGLAALIPLAGAFCYAAFQLLTRRMAGLEHPLTTHFYTGVIGAAIASLILLAFGAPLWEALLRAGPLAWAQMLGMGLFGTCGHLLLILAFGRAPVSLLMPFTYAQILFAMITGWLAFDHLPDVTSRWSMLIIAACGGAAVWLNARDNARIRMPGSRAAADTLTD